MIRAAMLIELDIPSGAGSRAGDTSSPMRASAAAVVVVAMVSFLDGASGLVPHELLLLLLLTEEIQSLHALPRVFLHADFFALRGGFLQLDFEDLAFEGFLVRLLGEHAEVLFVRDGGFDFGVFEGAWGGGLVAGVCGCRGGAAGGSVAVFCFGFVDVGAS